MAKFSTGVFSCFKDFGICLCGFFCPSCLSLRNSRMIFGATTCNCCDCCAGYVCPYVQRQILRAHYGMKQESLTDCACSWLCAPCVECQHARELDYMGIPRPQFKMCKNAVLTCIPPLKSQPSIPADN